MNYPLNKRIFTGVALFLLFLISAFFTSCVKKPPKGPDFPLGNDYEQFLYLKQRAEKNPDNMEIYIYLGEAYITLGQLDEAENCFDKVLKAHPTPPPSLISEAHRRLSHLYLNTGRFDACQEEARMIRKTYPWDRGVYDLQGHYWYCMKKTNRALFTYMGEFINSTCTDCYVGVGNIYQASGNIKKAEAIYRAGNVFDRECPFVRACRANLLISQKKFPQAEKLLQTSLLTDPELGELYVYMGNFKRAAGNLQNAVEWYNKALKIDRRCNEYAYAELGSTYIVMAEKEKEISMPIQAGIIFLLLLLPSLIIFAIISKKKKSDTPADKRKSLIGIIILFLIALIIIETAGLWLLNGNNSMAKVLNPRSFYYHRAIDTLSKAIKINPNRKDIRTKLAKAFRGINRVGDAKAEESIAALLPEYDIYARLRFIYP